jgi:hypothetical protein
MTILPTVSQPVGAQLIARAIAQADPELSDEVLTSNSRELNAVDLDRDPWRSRRPFDEAGF